MYTIVLTEQEWDASIWCAHRGYLPMEMISDGEIFYDDDTNTYTIHYPEHVAWALLFHREDDGDSLYACMGSELRSKWYELEFAIV